ncbi:hypothetical protein NDU88_001642 [Pleurodeles waltl]|uniref:NACHT domain-containing protein n=1 Tax=Pleurodeles waltl TaxID=8319 RepID=A0AAV7KTD3_PLEWA|nr:hypothetical protein NDU88_001642 [Pleurodeles waltl]
MAFADTTENEIQNFKRKLNEYSNGKLLRLCKYFQEDIRYVIANLDFRSVLHEFCFRGALFPEQAMKYEEIQTRRDSFSAASALLEKVFENQTTALALWQGLFALKKRCSHPNLLQILDEIINNGNNLLKEELLNESGYNLDPKLQVLQVSHRDNLYGKTSVLSEYMAPGSSQHPHKFPISGRYVELVVISERQYRNRARHEMLEAGELHEHHVKQKLQMGLERITPNRLFRWCYRSHRMPNSVIVTGVAGVGKTTLVQKFVFDWVEKKHYQKFAFVFLFKMREVNKHQELSIEQLLLHEYPYLRDGLQKILEDPQKLLFIFDGLDESKQPVDLGISANHLCNSPSDMRTIPIIVASLVRQTLLKGSFVLVTSRPRNLKKLEAGLFHRAAEIIGFLNKERERYFLRFYDSEDTSRAVFNYVKDTDVLYTLCYNPSYCWITCTALRSCFTQTSGCPSDPPKTVTQLFVYFISNILMNHSHPTKTTREEITQIGRLADHGIKNQIFIFHDEDLNTFHVTLGKIMSCFMLENISNDSKMTHEFLHLTIQEFLAALSYYIDHSDDKFKKLTERISSCTDGQYDIFIRFLAGLSHQPSRSVLKDYLGKFSAETTSEVIAWLGEKVANDLEIARNANDKRTFLNLFTYLFESRNSTLVREKVGQGSSLLFCHFYLTPVDCTILSYILKCCRELEILDLDSCRIQTEGLEKLRPNLHIVKELRLGSNDLKDAGIASVCAALTHPDCRIRTLSLKKNILTDNCCEELASALMKNETLASLDLGKNKIRDEGLETLLSVFGSNRCRIETLSLAENSLADDSCRKLRCLENCSVLKKLNLSANLLTDRCAKDIERLIRSCTSLTEIRLGINNFTTEMEKKLKSLSSLQPGLKIIV